MIELYDYVLVLLYFVLIIKDFQWSEFIYDNVIEECVHWQEGRIDGWIKFAKEYIELNTKDWVYSAKDFLLSTIKGVILPMIMDLIWK